MTKITNTDAKQSREVGIITEPTKNLQWCIATWPAPGYGRTKRSADGHGWQIVRRQDNGTYTYNGEMMGNFEDSLDAVRAMAVASGYKLI
jgi:hypothetical protein